MEAVEVILELVSLLMLPLAFIGLMVFSGRGARRHGYRARRSPPIRRVDHVFDPTRSLQLPTGGARVGWMNATWPFATLTVDHDWARLEVVGRTVWIQRSEVTEVHRFSSVGDGIMFRTEEGTFDGVIFWTMSSTVVLNAFAWYGWPVAPQPPPHPSWDRPQDPRLR